VPTALGGLAAATTTGKGAAEFERATEGMGVMGFMV
jgi:hypothetical protein